MPAPPEVEGQFLEARGWVEVSGRKVAKKTTGVVVRLRRN